VQTPSHSGVAIRISQPTGLWGVVLFASITLGIAALFMPLIYVVALLVGLVIIALVFWQPAVGGGIYICLVYSRLLEYLPQLQDYRILMLLSGLLGASLFVHNLLSGDRWWFGGVQLKILFIALAVCASIPLSIWKSNSVNASIDFLKIITSVLLIANSIKSERQLLWFTRLLVLSFMWLSWTVVWNYFAGNVGYEGGGEVIRAHGAGSTLGDSNEVMSYVLMLAPLALLGVRYEPATSLKVVYGLSIPASLAALVFSGSRGGFLGFLWLLFIFFIRSKHKVVYVVVGCFVFVTVWFSAPSTWRDRMLSIKDYKQDESAMIRIQLWQAARGMVKHNPVTGIGVGNFSEFAQNYGAGVGMVAHNTYYLFAGELGLLGLTAYVLYLLHIWRTGKRWSVSAEQNIVRQWLGEGLWLGYLVFLVPSYFVALSYYTHTYVPAAVLAAGERFYRAKRELTRDIHRVRTY